MTRIVRNTAAGFLMGMMFAAVGSAAEPVQQHNTNALWFENWGDMTNAMLKVSAPNGQMTSVETSSGTPVFQLTGPGIVDGMYSYELSAATSEKTEIVNQIDNGRGDNASTTEAVPFYMTGAFQVSRGVIVTPESVTEDGD